MTMSDISDNSSEISEISAISESDDSDMENFLYERRKPRNKNFYEETVPRFNETEFLEHFRMRRNVAEEIANRFANSEYFKYQSGPYEKLSPLKSTHIFLWFAAHETSSYRDVSDRFSISIASLYNIIKRFSYFLSNLSAELITFPSNEEQVEIERHFRQNKGFPGVIGAVDGTHIKIDKPLEDAESYINRKGYYSIQAQLVCDHKLRIRSLFVGYPGAVHDARVFRASPLLQTLEEHCGDKHLLGDSAYPLSYHLLTPFKDRGLLSRRQINYNFQHSSSRILIEHCNGVLKQKWRQLYHVKIRDIRTIVHFIRACCVLHNFTLDDRINNEVAVQEDNADPNNDLEQEENDDINRNAVEKRHRIVLAL